jgi:TATA-binding protein interacting (TIP20)
MTLEVLTFSMVGSTTSTFMYQHLVLFRECKLIKWLEIAVLDSLVEPIEKTINHKPKQDAVKQEVDRNEDMIRSALRAIASISRIGSSLCLSLSLSLSHTHTHTHRVHVYRDNQIFFDQNCFVTLYAFATVTVNCIRCLSFNPQP